MEREKYTNDPKTSFNFDALPKDFDDMYWERWYQKSIFFEDEFIFGAEYLEE